jgi:hypothetical protein
MNMVRVQDPWFQTYWDLRAWLARASSLGNTGLHLADELLTGSDFESAVEGCRGSAGAMKPPLAIPREFTDRGARFVERIAASKKAFPTMENVYQAAIYAMTRWGWNGNHFHDDVVFRGESSTKWSEKQFAASIYRSDPDERTLAERIRKLEVAAHWFRRKFRDRNDETIEIVAILQHYALPTWLLDVTTSIYAALYFASGEPDGTGVVYTYSTEEMKRYRVIAPELVPPVRQIKPQFVPRIDRQYGAFLDGGHGWSVRHLVFGELTFTQVPGMQFEDPGLGITKARLLANEGDWRWFENELQSSFNSVENPSTPTPGLLDFSEYQAALKKEYDSAPPLGVGPESVPEWPPALAALTACAARILAERSELDANRRRGAADAIAQYHRSLCADPRCSYFISSLHGYVEAVERLRRGLTNTEPGQYQVADLWHCYEGRAHSVEDNAFLHGKLRSLVQTLREVI